MLLGDWIELLKFKFLIRELSFILAGVVNMAFADTF